jgi:hypothetical protein
MQDAATPTTEAGQADAVSGVWRLPGLSAAESMPEAGQCGTWKLPQLGGAPVPPKPALSEIAALKTVSATPADGTDPLQDVVNGESARIAEERRRAFRGAGLDSEPEPSNAKPEKQDPYQAMFDDELVPEERQRKSRQARLLDAIYGDGAFKSLRNDGLDVQNVDLKSGILFFQCGSKGLLGAVAPSLFDGSCKLMDTGTKLQVSGHDPLKMAESLLGVAKLRGWSQMEVRGDEKTVAVITRYLEENGIAVVDRLRPAERKLEVEGDTNANIRDPKESTPTPASPAPRGMGM